MANRTEALLDRFLACLQALDPVAVWAHGSLAGGDYQEGRSDLDLIAVLAGPVTPRAVWQLGRLHARLRNEPLAPLLHCTYLTPTGRPIRSGGTSPGRTADCSGGRSPR